MLLGGEYKHGLDPKNRIFIPSKFREELGESFVVAKDIREKILKIYSREGWEAYIRPLTEQSRKFSEQIMRFLHSSLAQVTPDSQGRIVLPPELIEYAGLEKSVLIVGCGNYGEIWSEESYRKMREEEDVARMIQELESFGL